MFMKVKVGMLMETTGGDNSTNNKKTESPHQSLEKMTRCLLMLAAMDDKYWCFAMQYSCLLLNNTLHSVSKWIPVQHFSGWRDALPTSKVLMWGAKVRIVRSTHKNKVLDLRTTQDPSKAFHYALVKKAMPLNFHCGRFMGYGNHVHVMLVLKADNRIVRCRHGHVDEFGMTLKDEEGGLTPNEHLLCSYQSVGTDLADFRALLPQIEIAPSDLDFIPTPFVAKRCKELHITLHPWGTDHGLEFDLYISNCLPVLAAVHPMSPV